MMQRSLWGWKTFQTDYEAWNVSANNPDFPQIDSEHGPKLACVNDI